MNALFVAHGIDDVVSGARAKPNDNQSQEARIWIKDNAKAMFFISSAMEYPQLVDPHDREGNVGQPDNDS